MSSPRVSYYPSFFEGIKNRVTKTVSATFIGDVVRKLDEIIRFEMIKDSLNNEYIVTDEVLEELEGGGEIRKGKNKKTNVEVYVKRQSTEELIQFFLHQYSFQKSEAERCANNQLLLQDQIAKFTNRHVASIADGKTHYLVLRSHSKCNVEHDYSKLNEIQKLKIACSMAQQVRLLHAHRILHLNISLQSFLVQPDHSVILNENNLCAEQMPVECNWVVTPLKGWHLPPENILASKESLMRYSEKSDVFALGMVFFELFYNQYYGAVELENTKKEKIASYSEFYFTAFTFVSHDDSLVAPLICKMITNDVDQRITPAEAGDQLALMLKRIDAPIRECNAQPLPVTLPPIVKPAFSYSVCRLFAYGAIGAVAAVSAEYVRRYNSV